MANLTDVQENVALDYYTRAITPPALTGPIRVQMLSALGAGDAASTPITTGTTPLINLGATVPVAGANSNGATLRWEGIPNPTNLAGFRLLDSSVTPVVTLDNIPKSGGAVSVTDGIVEIAAGDLDTTAA